MWRAVRTSNAGEESSFEFFQQLPSHHGLLYTFAPDSCDDDKKLHFEMVARRP